MANDVDNNLTIFCPERSIKKRIKDLLLFANDRNYHSEYSNSPHQTNPSIKIKGHPGFCLDYYENKNSLQLIFLTSRFPNLKWVEQLCKKIERIYESDSIGSSDHCLIRIEYKYVCPGSEYAGIIKWTPNTGLLHKEYDNLAEYFLVEDKAMYETILQTYCPNDIEQAIRYYIHYSGL